MLPHRLIAAALLLLAAACSPATSAPGNQPAPSRPLKLASWNLEFLAQHNGMGCNPRDDSDYAAMRRIADGLDVDVIAFQEAENEAAAARIFDPAKYIVVMETRKGSPGGTCGGKFPAQTVIRQAVGFAIRKDMAFDRHADVTSLMRGNEQLRSGVDITLRPEGRTPIRLLGVHLKSGCFSGSEAKACPIFQDQIPALEAWIDAAAAGPERFAVLGDWNRRLALPGDAIWTEIDDGDPANADLTPADAGLQPACDPRYDSFIDHIVLDRRAAADRTAFTETLYAPGEKHYSDHCPIAVTLRR
ncbi:MAG: endonuclease [Dechloromonas sp.]|jgi:endonuclease/exonuclease/phosphatase family metal-dependent hydrolase|uniref:endonuclease/exonuclease/phosphatase family protein n=2 Tax=Sphingopyxis TaxID=165697 RepID=UPI00086F7E6D|nr:endonuclease [uncultured Sphingopyxis sp.]KAB2919416.1 MAG: endonuclease [Dechloromonas sp.]MBN8843601.1 endonuclease [Sphingomonadales bacterium]ODU32349.1 MAG: endonuclease [Sphingopyxis sp. SCN 67-31]